MYGDNQSLLANTTMPKSILNNKSNTVAFHFLQEGSARDEWRTAYINKHIYASDMMKKLLPSGDKHIILLKIILYHL